MSEALINVVKLTPKQQRFVDEYLIDLNATQAATRAGYSPRTANEQAARLLVNVSIQEAIQKARKAQEKRTQISADKILEEYAKIAFSNIQDFAEFNDGTVRLISSEEIDREKLAAIESVSETKDGVRLKLHSKLSALDKLAQHLGIDKPNSIADDSEADSNIIEALNATVDEVWNDEIEQGEDDGQAEE